MIIQKCVFEPAEIEVKEITLLSIKEYEAAKDLVPMVDSFWWLRSPGYELNYAAVVDYDGSVCDDSCNVFFTRVGIRPALRISNLESSNLLPGEKVWIAGKGWTVISNDLILCDVFVGQGPFLKTMRSTDANNFEKSDVKKWLHKWAAENGIEITKE